MIFYDYNPIRNEAYEIYEIIKKAGIFYSAPKEAADHLNKIWDEGKDVNEVMESYYYHEAINATFQINGLNYRKAYNNMIYSHNYSWYIFEDPVIKN